MNQRIENELDKIAHYQRFPLMKPFVGENYFASKKRTLFIGESHFFDMDESKITKEYINSSPSKWYSSSLNDLHLSKHDSINTRNVVNTSSHMVFRELEKILCLIFDMQNSRAINNIAFMNGFQRPANKYGASIKSIASERDFEEGAQTVESVVKILEPEYVIFISKFTWEKIGSRINRVEGVIYEFINHPAAFRYWNDKQNAHSKYRLVQLLS
jgi:hypothetical protein